MASSNEFIKCNNCGVEVPQTAKFCPSCGELLTVTDENSSIASGKNQDENLTTIEAGLNKRKKSISIAILIFFVCIAILILMTKVIIPNSNYDSALRLYNNGKYEEAIAAFEAMNGYKDSAAQIENCEEAIREENYNSAMELYNNGKYEEAIAVFMAMDGYKDSAVQIENCEEAIREENYNSALELYNNGKYEEAIATFEAMDGYKDSTALIENCKAAVKEQYISNCTSFSYEDINRRANNYIGQYIKVKGRVLQVLEQGNVLRTLRVADEGSTNVYYVEYIGDVLEERIIEDDYITVYGVLNGYKTYNTVKNTTVTIPLVTSKYILPEAVNSKLSMYNIHDLSNADYSYQYTTGNGVSGSSEAIKGTIYVEWAVAYDKKNGYENVKDNFFVPDGNSACTFTELTNEFDNLPGYEWRGIHVKYHFDKRYFFIVHNLFDYYSLKECDSGALENQSYTSSIFSISYNGKMYNSCKVVAYGTSSNKYYYDTYTFYRVPKGYDGCCVGIVDTRGEEGFTGNRHSSDSLVNQLGSNPVIFRLR